MRERAGEEMPMVLSSRSSGAVVTPKAALDGQEPSSRRAAIAAG